MLRKAEMRKQTSIAIPIASVSPSKDKIITFWVCIFLSLFLLSIVCLYLHLYVSASRKQLDGCVLLVNPVIMSRHNHHNWAPSRRRTRSSSSVEDGSNQVKIEHWNRVGGQLDLFRLNEKFCDVSIIVETETFKAHKIVLASCSSYFEAMFTIGLDEESKDVIELKEIRPDVFKMIIDYMYKGELVISEYNVQDLLAAANFLNMHEVVTNCSNFLRKKLHSSNAVGIFRFAELHCCTVLKLEAKRFVERHFPEVILDEEFYELPKNMLVSFLRSEGLSIYNEYQVLDATFKWLLKYADDRLTDAADLLDCIRLPLISPKQIEGLFNECSNANLKEVLIGYMNGFKDDLQKQQIDRQTFLSMPGPSGISDFQNSYHDVRSQPRICCRKSIYVIGGNHQTGNYWNDGRTLNTVEKLDTFKWQWKSLPQMNHSRSCHGLTVLNGILYAVGGETDLMILDAVESYDPLDNEWSTVCSLRQPRSCLGLCALDGALYAFGGWIGLKVDNCIEKFDPLTEKWEIADKMPHSMFAMGVIAYEGLVYLIGGFDEASNALNSIYSYNPVTRQFVSLTAMGQRRGYFGIALLHNSIYVVGGTSGPGSSLASVERYSIFDNSWTEIAPMSVARIGPCVAAVKDTLLVIGGKTVGEDEYTIPYTLDSVEIYDPERNKWKDGHSMPTSRCDAAACVL